MSILYWLFINQVGYLDLGQLAFYFQLDLIIALLLVIAIYTIKRWDKLWK